MGAAFWMRRFLLVLGGAFVLICTVQLLKGHGLAYAAAQGALWSGISSTVFTTARFVQARRGQHCAICKDTPEMRQADGSDAYFAIRCADGERKLMVQQFIHAEVDSWLGQIQASGPP